MVSHWMLSCFRKHRAFLQSHALHNLAHGEGGQVLHPTNGDNWPNQEIHIPVEGFSQAERDCGLYVIQLVDICRKSRMEYTW
jgi:hypothetical protein